MTHYNVDYSSLQEPAKSEKAIADLREFAGEKRFETMIALTEQVGREQLQGAIELFIGASGFPVTAFLDRYYGSGK